MSSTPRYDATYLVWFRSGCVVVSSEDARMIAASDVADVSVYDRLSGCKICIARAEIRQFGSVIIGAESTDIVWAGPVQDDEIGK